MSKTREELKLDLSLHDKDKNILDMKKKMLEEELISLSPLDEGTINISTSYVFDNNDKVEVGVFFRNGLKTPVNFDSISLNLLDDNNNVVCTQHFCLEKLGIIPEFSARPYELFFDKKNISSNISINNNFKVSFTHNIKTVSTYI